MPLKKDKNTKNRELSKTCSRDSLVILKTSVQAAQLRVVNELFESGKAWKQRLIRVPYL